MRSKELTGLLAGICWQSIRDPVPEIAEVASDEIAEAAQSVQFHLAQTVACIAHHKFEAARLHAREEEWAREKLRQLQSSSAAPSSQSSP